MAHGLIESRIASIANDAQGYDPSDASTRQALIHQISVLLRTIATPADLLSMHMAQMMELVTVRTLMSLNVFQKLPETGSISLNDLSIAVGAEPALVGRLLRMACACQLVHQLPDLSYASTPFSAAYAADPGPGLAFNLAYDESLLNICRLHQYLAEKGPEEPKSQYTSPYCWTEKQEGKAVWEIMAQYPDRLRTFQRGLPFYHAHLKTTGYYDFSKLVDDSDRPILVDIGGGIGGSLTAIMAAHPEIKPDRLILQDLPDVIAVAEDAKKRCELPADVKTMVHDFYSPQPIKAAKAYFLRHILHDYSDPISTTILSQIVPAMSADSVILIADFILPDRISPADIDAATAGIAIINMSGKERSYSELRAVLEAAGLEMVGVYKPEMGNYGIVEARLIGAGRGLDEVPVREGGVCCKL